MKDERYSLIYRLKKKEHGSGLHAIFLSQTYPDIFNAIDYENESIPEMNRVWLLHKPTFYRYSLTQRADDINCIRADYCQNVVGIKATNGYSYFRKHLCCFDQWFPTIYDSQFEVNSQPSIGYYIRDVRQQSNYAFLDFIHKIPDEFSIVTMGTKELIESHLAKRKNWHHTYSNEEFWRSCSHYFYYRASDVEDPFPHTLLEAIQSKHRIISLKDPNRSHLDGIDDLLSCIDYDESFVPDASGHASDVLSSKIWSNYIHQLVHSRFKMKPNPINRGLLYDWIDHNLR